MLALRWHSTPAYYAFYCAGIFDAGLLVGLLHVVQNKPQLHFSLALFMCI